MNYQRIYDNIINTALLEQSSKKRFKGDGQYYESHHIIPRCMGGIDMGTVLLTAKEHFICHELLCEIYPNNNKLKYALWRMITGLVSSILNKNFKPSGIVYERIRKEISRIRKETMTSTQIERIRQLGKDKKGIKLSEEHKRRISESGRGKIMSEETKQLISLKNKGNKPWNKGTLLGKRDPSIIQKIVDVRNKNGSYVHKEETKIKISEGNKGKIVSEETRNKIGRANRISQLGKKQSEETKKKKSVSMMGKNVGKGIGKIMSEETRLKIAKSLRGKPTHNKGKQTPEEIKRKISESMRKHFKDKKESLLK